MCVSPSSHQNCIFKLFDHILTDRENTACLKKKMSKRRPLKRISKWPNKWKDIRPHQSLGKCILKAQWESTPLLDIGGFCSTRNSQTLLDKNVNCYNTLGSSFEWVEGTHTHLPSSSFFDYTCSSEDMYKKVYGILVHDGSKLECPLTVSEHNKFLLSSVQQKRNTEPHLPTQMCLISVVGTKET